MLCQRCGEKEATVHLTKIVNGEKSELFLCEDCARETGQISFGSSEPFTFQNLLSGILNPKFGSSLKENAADLTCDSCGMSYSDFTQKGLFGCANCYETFGERLTPLLKRIHGSTDHTGKVPKRRGGNLRTKKEIEELRSEMETAVEEENFERAAELRDKIHELEENLRSE